MSTVKAIDTLDEIMEEIATSDETLFIVRFHHSFCIPCINTTPTFVNLSKGHHPGVVFVDADIWNHGEIAKHFRIRHVPTYLAIKRQQEIHGYTGIKKSSLVNFFNRALELHREPNEAQDQRTEDEN